MAAWSVRRRRPSVSIAMATYQGETYLPRQLQSLADQTLEPRELVVRDDGSTDGTLEILRAFAARARFPVTVLEGERLGYAQNFVTAARYCTGDLLFFADQDDEWRPAKLETVAEAWEPGQPQALFHDFALMGADGAEFAPSAYAVLEQRGLGRVVALKGCTMAVTRAFVDLWGWPPAGTTISHDFWVALLATAFRQRTNVDAVLIDHRLHEEQASGWVPDDSSRTFTSADKPVGDLELMLDLVVKERRSVGWTREFLDVTDRVGDRVSPESAERFRKRLRTNRRRHRQAKQAAAEASGSAT
jgi:glycosyltransferase involved in cell wall biosynthesis